MPIARPPFVLSFLVCRDIQRDAGNGEYTLVSPFMGFNLDTFPALLRVALYLQVADASGLSGLTLEMQTEEGEVIGHCVAPATVMPYDPYAPCQLCWRDLVLHFERPGKYHLILRADGKELARRELAITYKDQPGAAGHSNLGSRLELWPHQA